MISIGTDCSGIEAPLQALNDLGIKYIHKFSSEKDKFARKSLLANYNPDILYEDMTIVRDLPQVDIYICGFPCQPFSLAGKLLGIDDERCIFDHVIIAIKKCNPKIFILENVSNIVNNSYFDYIKSELGKLEYNLSYEIVNTKNYGIPQNRKRLYIIGSKVGKFNMPIGYSCEDIINFIDFSDEDYEEYPPHILKKYEQIKDGIFVNVGMIRNSKYKVNVDFSSCLTANSNLYNIFMHRKANIKEHLMLQGFNSNFKQVVSDTQMKKQIGNSMSVNVIKVILEECIKKLM